MRTIGVIGKHDGLVRSKDRDRWQNRRRSNRSTLICTKKLGDVVRNLKKGNNRGVERKRRFEGERSKRSERQTCEPHAARCSRSKADIHALSVQSQRANNVATAAPISWATTKAATPAGAIPEKVLDKARATVTAGFANDVEAVNQ